MIIIKKYITYLRILGLFSLAELLIIFINSILNIIGLSSSITTIVIIISNIICFTIFGFINSKNSNQKGLLSGLLIGLILICFLFLVNTIFYHFRFETNKIIYYLILVLSSIIGGIFGKNISSNTNT